MFATKEKRWSVRLLILRGGHAVIVTSLLFLSGCLASTKNPDRLYPVPDVVAFVQSSQNELIKQYHEDFRTMSRDDARKLRNEIIAERMYASDVQYTQYESSLTKERQDVGFTTLTAAEALSTAATIVTPVVTKTILSGVTTGLVAMKGHYESEVLLAQTMRTIQKQMRLSRNKVAEHIFQRMAQDVSDYPLSAALADLEEYYRAGTLTSGVMDTSTTVGIEEKRSEDEKRAAAFLIPIRTSDVADPNTDVLLKYLRPGGVYSVKNRDELQRILTVEIGSGEKLGRIVRGSYGVVIRAELVRKAKASKVLNP